MKIVTIVGARPQFIKAAVVSRAIKSHNENISSLGEMVQEIIIHTGQHFDRNMSDVFFEEMHIPKPDYCLGISSLSHAAMTGQMLEKIEDILLQEKPEHVLVYGDTNSTLAGALAASKLHIPVAHVEAGLRSFNRKMPEEINRVLVDHISDYLFCPTDQAVKNLEIEGISGSSSPFTPSQTMRAYLVGDVMLDAANYYKKFARQPACKLPEQFILATIHRAENTDDEDRLKSIFMAFDSISQNTPILMPLHPRTRKKLAQFGLKPGRGIITVDPVSYLEMVFLIDHCSLVMTDSGGLQKEAFFFKKVCVTLRDETEWVELVEGGYNILAGANKNNIHQAFEKAMNTFADFSVELYGRGNAAEKVVERLCFK